MAHLLNNPARPGELSSTTSVPKSANIDKSMILHSKEGGSVRVAHTSYHADPGSTSRGVNSSWTASLENLDVKPGKEVVDRHIEVIKDFARKYLVVEGGPPLSSSLFDSTPDRRGFIGTNRENPLELHFQRRYRKSTPISPLSDSSVHVQIPLLDPSAPLTSAVEEGQPPLPLRRQYTALIHGPPWGTNLRQTTLDTRSSYSSVFSPRLTN